MNPRLRFFKRIPEQLVTYTIASCRVGAWSGAAVGVALGTFDSNKAYAAAKQGDVGPVQAASNAAIVTFSRCTLAGMVAGPLVGFSPLWVTGLWGAKRALRNSNIDENKNEPRPNV